MRNIKINIEYDGTNYHGWQRQPNGLTIQEVLEEKICIITQERIKLIGSGRTDAGVHAINQVANFITTSKIEIRGLLRGINSLLPSDIVVTDLLEVDRNFHSRYNAKSKMYSYKIFNNPLRSALLRNYSWHIYELIDISRMREASLFLEGTHDFSSFCAANGDAKNHVRTIMEVDIESDKNGIIIFSIEGNGFLRYMVRNIVGALMDVGKQKITPNEFRSILEAKDRTKAGRTAPPQGLYLKNVKYQ